MPSPSARLGYLDWMRGLAVLIMIEAHVMDAWLLTADRSRTAYRNSVILGGFGAPLFLFLAGVAIVLAAESKRRRLGSDTAAAAAVCRRGLEIFVLAFLFRLQSFVLGGGYSLRSLLKVDILNVMGPAMIAATLIWLAGRTPGKRLAAFAAVTLAIGMVTPILRATPLLAALPDPLEGYLRPAAGLTTFTLFPWAGFTIAGAFVGVLIDSARTREEQVRLMIGLAIGGAVVGITGYAMSFLPTIYASASFWTSSPTFYLLRVGVLTTAVPLVWAWSERSVWLGYARRWSPMEEFGRSSLFVYWIHVEMVYGLVSAPIHRRLPFVQCVMAWAVFTIFLFALVLLKNWIKRRWRERQSGGRAMNPLAQT